MFNEIAHKNCVSAYDFQSHGDMSANFPPHYLFNKQLKI